MAGISALVVSVCYLIPQMVGAGALVTPLLGLPHFVGVVMVGAIVIFIVATAGMASTTYVQFFKGALLLICSSIVVGLVLCDHLLPGTLGTDFLVDYGSIAMVDLNGDNIGDISFTDCDAILTIFLLLYNIRSPCRNCLSKSS